MFSLRQSSISEDVEKLNGSESQLDDTPFTSAAREVLEQALIDIARLHEQQLTEHQDYFRQHPGAKISRAQQAVVSIDGDDVLLKEVADWYTASHEQCEDNHKRSMMALTKNGDGISTSSNGVKFTSDRADPNDIDLDVSMERDVLDGSEINFSVAMAVAAEVQAEREDGFSQMSGDLVQERTPPPGKRGFFASEDNSGASKSMAASMCSSEYMYSSPSEPRPEDELDSTSALTCWVRMVQGVLMFSKEKKLYELRDPWVQPDWFLAKMMRQQENLDLFHPKNVNARHHSNNRRTTRILQMEDLDSLDGDEVTFKEKCQYCLESLVLDPQSPKRICWMSIGMLLMIYDLFVLPLQAFPMPSSKFLRGMQWFGQIFWTLDIAISFFTGVYVNSELVVRLSTIARVYCSTWFIFDLLVVVPLWVVEFLGVQTGASKSTAVFKYARMLRFLRLARLAKFEHYLQEALATVNSSALLLCFGMFKQMSGLIVINHINACCWYAVGQHGSGGWVEVYEDTPLIYRYLTSMHWAFTQFQGTSEIVPTIGTGREVLERLHAVLTVMFALIILAFFVSRLTNMMLQLQQLRDERTGMQRAVRAYLCANNISLQLSVRVKKYIDWKQKMQTKGRSSEVLNNLPQHLQMDCQEEVRSPLITTHTLFAAFRATHLRFFRLLCFEGLREITPAPRELLFIPNDHAQQMYFIVTGTFRYFSSRLAMVAKHHMIEEVLNSMEQEHDVMVLSTGKWLSEPALWTKWDHRGGCMGINDSVLLTLSAADFGRISKGYGPAHASGVLYARMFVAGLNRFGKNYNDVLDSDALMHEMADQRFSVTQSVSIR